MKNRLLGLLMVVLLLISIPWPMAQAATEVQDDLAFRLNKDGESYSVHGYGQISGDLVIPGEFKGKPVTVIPGKAFSHYYNVTNLTIPDSVTTIGEYAFSGCFRMTSVTIPDSVITLGECAFSECTSLTSITIPDSVTTIGDCAFLGCTGLTTITIPDSVTNIGIDLFRHCNIQTIYCSKSSEAAKMAAKYNIPVKYLCNGHIWDETETVGATCKTPGSISYVCKNCDETKQEPIAQLKEHTYSNACDDRCDVCGQTRTVAHTYSAQWNKDTDHHWRQCSGCNEVSDRGAHTWNEGVAGEGEIVYTCTVCGANITEKIVETIPDETEPEETVPDVTLPTETAPEETLPNESVADTTAPEVSVPEETESAPTVPDETNNEKGDQTKTNFLWWAIPAAVAVVGGGSAAFVIIKKKKN